MSYIFYDYFSPTGSKKSAEQLHVHNFALKFIVHAKGRNRHKCLRHHEDVIMYIWVSKRIQSNVALYDKPLYLWVMCKMCGVAKVQYMSVYVFVVGMQILCIVKTIKLLLLMVQVEQLRVSKHVMCSFHRHRPVKWKDQLMLLYIMLPELHLHPYHSVPKCYSTRLHFISEACRILGISMM